MDMPDYFSKYKKDTPFYEAACAAWAYSQDFRAEMIRADRDPAWRTSVSDRIMHWWRAEAKKD